MGTIRGSKKNSDRKADRCGAGGVGTVPGHLARRLKAFEAMSNSRNFNSLAYHRPGSTKK